MKALFENQEGTAKVLSNSAMKKVLGGIRGNIEFSEHEGCFAKCRDGRVPISAEKCLEGTEHNICEGYSGCYCE